MIPDLQLLQELRIMLPGRWTQGFNALKYGEEGKLEYTSPIDPKAACFCLRGGCIRVLAPTVRAISTLFVLDTVESMQIPRALGFHNNAEVVKWNDEDGRTEKDVLTFIDRRIRQLRRGGAEETSSQVEGKV